MSVVLCLKSTLFSIVTTDTKICWRNIFDESVNDTSDNEKLLDLKVGWFAGAGASDLIDDVGLSLSEMVYIDTNKLKNIYSKSYTANIEKAEYDKYWLDITAIVTSWIQYDQKPFKIGIVGFNLETNQIQAREPDENNIELLWPKEYIEDHSKILALIQKFNNFPCDTLYSCMNQIFCIFKEITENSKSVSETCDTGILVCDNNSLKKIRITDNIDRLIADYKNDYSNITQKLVWSFPLQN